ncbi:hypothetical protein KP509_1Z243300 [Ceratopteris richardii]|nr:hypothetical protein KP509_1Z243300 [Ceratopteris richardii]
MACQYVHMVDAKKLDRRLNDLGGHQIIERGLGDDQHPSGYEASLDSWLISLWKALENITGWPLDFSNLSKSALTLDSPKYSVISFSAPSEMSARESESLESMKRAVSMMEAADATHECKEPLDMSVFGQRNPYLARMICNKRLTKDYSERDVRHIEFDLGNSGMNYKPGDALAIMPSQSEHAVDTFLSRCSLDPDDLVLVQAAHKYDDSQHKDSNMTTPVTIRTLVKAVLDVASASPRRYFFEELK